MHMKSGKIRVRNHVAISLGVSALGKETRVMPLLNDDKSNSWIIVLLDVSTYL